ncbi:MAG TPA: adenylate/guanylate cyclase domain-containing protein [Gaiellaceae bacterium]|nr:adenylate/guanylate cyclase domain-containing protein [Gaiellaceae bacterium]
MLVRKTVTILFSDVVTSTELGEQLDPESLRRLMSRYFDEMRAIVEHHGGTVEKFIGDEVMAVFGIPIVHEDDALRAVRAAAEMCDRLSTLNEEFEKTWGVRLNARTGVNTGQVVAGDPLAGGTYVSGDPVVLAKRLEQAAAPGQILIGQATHALVKDAIKAGPLESFSVKGKAQPVAPLRVDEVDADAPGLTRRLDAPLVGRRTELARLSEDFHEAARSNACRLLTVFGPAGIGKTRLAAELSERLGDRAEWLTGRCLPYGEGITFWPLAQIVREAGGIGAIAAALDGSDDADVVVELLQGAIGPSPAAGGSDAIFWAVRRVLEALAARKPLVVCLEDIHWAERTFLDLVEYLTAWIRGTPIFLLCLARPDLLETEPAWMTPRPNASILVLEPLSEPEADVLLDSLRGDVTLSDAVRRRIAATSEGNPLFVEQMVAMAAENEDGELTVPPSIYALLDERLDRLSPEERVVVERASVIGKEFVLREIIELCPPELRPNVVRNLMALVRKDLVRPASSTAAREDAFRFRHALIRDAAYDGLPKEVRAELHEHFAAQVEAQTYVGEHQVELEEIIGYHLEQAVRCRVDLGRLDRSTDELALRAGARLAGAGRRAFARGDVPAARKLLGRAVRLLDAHPEARAEALLELGAVAREEGDAVEADAVLTDAETLARSVGDQRLRLRVEVERSVLRLYVDSDIEPRQLLEVAEQATPVFEAGGDQLGLSRAWALVAEAQWFRSQFAMMEDVLGRARVYAERAGDRRTMSWILGAMCRVAVVGPLPVDEGIRRCTAIREEARGEPALQPVVESMLAVLEAMRGRFDVARGHYRESQRAFEELGFTFRLASYRMYSGWTELIAGNAQAAERELRIGYEVLDSMGERSTVSTVAAFLARAVLAQGRLDEAGRLSEVSEETASADDPITQAMWRGTRARVIAAGRSHADAERFARESVELSLETDCVNMQADALVDLAETLRLLRRPDETGDILEQAIDLYEKKGNVTSAAAVRPLLAAQQPVEVDSRGAE